MFDFNEFIDNFLSREPRKKTIGRYYPSEIGSCLRKVWYSYKYPIRPEPEKIRIFKMGDLIHDFVTDVLKSEKNPDIELINSEFPFKLEEKDFIVSGRVDNLILLKEGNKKILVEVKSTKNIDYISYAQEFHEMQLQMYMHAFKIFNGLILYLEKNTLNSKSFEIPYKKAMALRVIERFKTLHNHLTNGSLPLPEAKQDEGMSWLCRFCEYRGQCDSQTISE